MADIGLPDVITQAGPQQAKPDRATQQTAADNNRVIGHLAAPQRNAQSAQPELKES